MNPVRTAAIGLGARGYSMLHALLLHMDNVKITAVCDGRDIDYRIEISAAPGECARIAREAAFFEARHAGILADGDPYFNPGLSLNSTAFIPRGRLGRLKLLQRRNKS